MSMGMSELQLPVHPGMLSFSPHRLFESRVRVQNGLRAEGVSL